ncbi:hypothetical protein FRC03_003202 [Tulasnella sp. 419]|nr:hypothetical protein FRC03_003202 [Tulasnella sp. 419]
MFQNVPSLLNNSSEIMKDQNLICLRHTSAFEVESLLHVVEARFLDECPKVSLEQWKAVLNLTTLWQNDVLRRIAINEIDKFYFPPITKLRLASRFRVDGWLGPASLALCLRPTPLTIRERRLLGSPFASKICLIQDMLSRNQLLRLRCNNCRKTLENCSGYIRSLEMDGVNPFNIHPSTASSTYPFASESLCPELSIESLRERKAIELVGDLVAGRVRPLPEDSSEETELPETVRPGGRHTRFYCDDEVVYQIGETLFRTPTNLLRPFRVLCDLLKLNAPNQRDINTVINLGTNISALEMSAVLDILNARWYSNTQFFTCEQWKASLRVATIWDYADLRDISNGMIKWFNLPLAESWFPARHFHIPQSVLTALPNLCTRNEDLSAQERRLLGDVISQVVLMVKSCIRNQSNFVCHDLTVSMTCQSCHAVAEQMAIILAREFLESRAGRQ